MKTEKLNLLQNKVVEFHKPNSIYCKGFLYKNGTGFYIKVVEDAGTITSKDIIPLEDGDDEYITQADKPRLMRVSLKSWHYRLVKWVLGDNAPTPKNMQNGCPYFWLLILSIFAAPFKLIGGLFYKIIIFFPEMFFNYIDSSMDNWVKDLDDKEAFNLYYDGVSRNKIPPMPKRYLKRKYSGSTHIFGDDFFETYMEKKYNLTPHDNEYYKVKYRIQREWRIWDREQTTMHSQINKERRELEAQKRKIAYEKKVAWEKKITPIQNAFDKTIDSIIDTFTFNYDWSTLIRRTKQVVGGLVTIFLLFLSYILVNMFSYLIVGLTDVIIEYWKIAVGLLIIAAGFGLIYVLYYVLFAWIQTVIEKYKRGRKVWYVEAPIYLIYVPLKYVTIAIATVVIYVLWKPFEFGGYKVLWLLFLFPVGKWLFKGMKKLWFAVLGSTGIFGEYFNASYTDYCPGIEWADTDEE